MNSKRFSSARLASGGFFTVLVVLGVWSFGNAGPVPEASARPAPPLPQFNDPLGAQWDEQESGQTATWTRRAGGNTFDARWSSGTRAVLEVTLVGTRVTIMRRQGSDGNDCDYIGMLSGTEISGTYTCTSARSPMPWRATVRAVAVGPSSGARPIDAIYIPPSSGTQAPTWSRGIQDLPINDRECLRRAEMAFQAEGYTVNVRGGGQAHIAGFKANHTAVIMCNDWQPGRSWVNIVVATNDPRQDGTVPGAEREKLQRQMAQAGAGGSAGAATGTPGQITLQWAGMTRDEVAPGGGASPDGKPDAAFLLDASRAGSPIVTIELYGSDAQGQPKGNRWSTRGGGYWMLGVTTGAGRVNGAGYMENLNLAPQTLTIFAAEPGQAFVRGQYFAVEVSLADGRRMIGVAMVQ